MKYLWIALISILALALAVFYYLTFSPKSAKSSPIVQPTIDNKIQLIKDYKIPILMYHYIRVADPSDKMGLALSVTPENFNLQMEWLKNNDYSSMKLADIADPQQVVLQNLISQNKKPIVITFDDGYTDAYTKAFPILKKYDFTGTFFIIRHSVGAKNNFYMNENQINEMQENNMEIGSHSLTHPNLTTISFEKLNNEIFNSKNESQVFCYPSGRYNEETMNLVKKAGYKAAVTTKDGTTNQDSNLLELPRKRITNTSLEEFIKKVSE